MTAPTQPDPLDALLRLALDATYPPHPWWDDDQLREALEEVGVDSTMMRDHDAAFIAACDPATVVGLIERVREAEAAYEREDDAHAETVQELELATLRAEAAEQRVKELEERLAVWTTTNTAAVKAYDTASAERDAAEAREQALRDRVEALADKWTEEHDDSDDCETCWLIQEIRTILSPPTADDRGRLADKSQGAASASEPPEVPDALAAPTADTPKKRTVVEACDGCKSGAHQWYDHARPFAPTADTEESDRG